LQHQELVGDDLAHSELEHLTIAHDTRLRRVENRQLVQRFASPQLLDDADGAVGDDDAGEQCILGLSGYEDQHEQGADDGVDAREHVGADDLADGAHGCVGDEVDTTLRHSFLYFGGRETGLWWRCGSGHGAGG
jgi:hypothetical protein